LRAADITPVKTTRGYQLVTEDQLSAVDSTLRIVAVKKGSRAKNLKLTVDSVGELFLPTTTDLSGFEIQIKRGARLLKNLKIT
jgi:hypothetical protein